MPENTLDVRGRPPFERHAAVHEAFSALESGEALTVVADRDPEPVADALRDAAEGFDEEGYAVGRRGPGEFVATLPKE